MRGCSGCPARSFLPCPNWAENPQLDFNMKRALLPPRHVLQFTVLHLSTPHAPSVPLLQPPPYPVPCSYLQFHYFHRLHSKCKWGSKSNIATDGMV